MSCFKQFREEQGFPMKTVTVKLKDGRTFVEKMDCHPGHPDNMMSREQFADRFRAQKRLIFGLHIRQILSD